MFNEPDNSSNPLEVSPETLALKSYSLRYPVTPWICRDRASAADAASALTETTKISNLIGRLRKKLGVDIIKTARGLGYVVGVDEETPAAR